MTNISDDECVAMKYVFANEGKKTFLECSIEEREEIINAKIDGRCELRSKKNSVWVKAENNIITLGAVYRARKPAPTPNEIDWSQFPAWVKCCVTNVYNRTCIYDSIAEFSSLKGKWSHGHGCNKPAIEITDFPGFKRGTVGWKDSLLIKPEGK